MHDFIALELSQIASVPKDAASRHYPARDGLYFFSQMSGNQQEMAMTQSYETELFVRIRTMRAVRKHSIFFKKSIVNK